jgi:hypothetical protein
MEIIRFVILRPDSVQPGQRTECAALDRTAESGILAAGLASRKAPSIRDYDVDLAHS